ncbi:MAG: sensor histidine kinase [Paracoccaceae bacterium]
MAAESQTDSPAGERRPSRFLVRLVVIMVIVVALATVWVTNRLLTERFTADTRSRAELRIALYVGNILSELQRNSVVPLLLARDPALIGALGSGDFSVTSARLISAQEEIGAASIILLDAEGHTVAATNRNRLGTNYRQSAMFIEAMRSNDTVFTAVKGEAGGFEFTYARAVKLESNAVGVVAVEVDLSKFERAWAGIWDALLVVDSEGIIVLATEPRWRGKTIDEALATQSAPSAIQRAFRATADWTQPAPDAYLLGEAVMRNDVRIPFRGWTLVGFTSYDSVREQVAGAIALEIMGFAILTSLAFFVMSRRATSRSRVFQQESAELRRLYQQLKREIAEREKVQKELAVAEQTLAQSSKLAALGEMSASVSHELNQPLAAMKTYLAGAKLLLQRRRTDEALSSFQRIDDLIERMGAITRQLKSYARKGGEALETVDIKSCVSSALSMMEPQLRTRKVRILRSIPRHPVLVTVDRIRLEQVIINLLRNALDATLDSTEPQIEIVVAEGEMVVLSVRDNGHGIEDLENLFEPFYTTKKPGDGIGLGLAISSGIVKDLGGRLIARNGSAGGAVFEVHLPRQDRRSQAAE